MRFSSLLAALAAAPLATLAGLPGCSSSSESAPSVVLPADVTTAEGPVHGDTSTAGVRVFRGIPYAAAASGDLRWRPPQAVTPWTATLDATAFGAQCMQAGIMGYAPPNESEDCLFLNVWTPASRPADAKPMPVMVWMHGGAFILGSSSDPMYEATRFASSNDVMVVSMNYRLGIFGFLADEKAGANFGLQDQKAALEWVKRNAAAFGGDPGNVTIFGESAGGQSVSLLSLWPEAAPFFHRAIVQSGPATLIPALPMADAQKQTRDAGIAVGCDPSGDVVACLRGIPADKLVDALHFDKADQPPGGMLQGNVPTAPWFPVVDGNVVRESPADMLAKGMLAKVPYIMGTTQSEAVLFHSGFLGDSPVPTKDLYEKALGITFGDQASKIEAQYPIEKFKDGTDAIAHVETFAFFTCPTRRQARAAQSPVYLYQLTRPATGGFLSGLGPIHGTDFIYLFGNDGSVYGSPGDDGQPLVGSMQSYWSSLARSGDPNAAGGQPSWPLFGADAKSAALDVPVTMAADVAKDDCDFWDGITPPKSLPPMYTPPKAPAAAAGN